MKQAEDFQPYSRIRKLFCLRVEFTPIYFNVRPFLTRNVWCVWRHQAIRSRCVTSNFSTLLQQMHGIPRSLQNSDIDFKHFSNFQNQYSSKIFKYFLHLPKCKLKRYIWFVLSGIKQKRTSKQRNTHRTYEHAGRELSCKWEGSRAKATRNGLLIGASKMAQTS